MLKKKLHQQRHRHCPTAKPKKQTLTMWLAHHNSVVQLPFGHFVMHVVLLRPLYKHPKGDSKESEISVVFSFFPPQSVDVFKTWTTHPMNVIFFLSLPTMTGNLLKRGGVRGPSLKALSNHGKTMSAISSHTNSETIPRKTKVIPKQQTCLSSLPITKYHRSRY